MYELHVLPDGTKIFDKVRSSYVPASDEGYQAWITETRLVFTYAEEQQEETYTVVDEEGNESTATRMITVTVATPVMVEGVQQTELVNSMNTLTCHGPWVLPVILDPTDHELLMAIATIVEEIAE